jgi:hypothetical protein
MDARYIYFNMNSRLISKMTKKKKHLSHTHTYCYAVYTPLYSTIKYTLVRFLIPSLVDIVLGYVQTDDIIPEHNERKADHDSRMFDFA